MKNLLCTILVASIAIACGSAPDKAAKLNIPKWAVDQPDLCGLGIQKFRGNISTDRTVANAKARADLSRQIETKVKSMIKAYAATGEAEGEDFTEETSRIAVVNLSKTTINGAVPKKFDMMDDNIYTLVCLNPGVLTDAISNMKQLSHAQRAALEKRARLAHKDLEKQMETYDD
jgi:hypothetical protein